MSTGVIRRLHSIDLGTLAPEYANSGVNEFYKKGCQEESSALTGGEILFSRSSPLKFRFPGEVRSLAHAHKFPPRRVAIAIKFERAASPTGAQGQPWFYPRLVAYGYFWFSEGA